MQPIEVAGFGLATALGEGAAAHLHALRANRAGYACVTMDLAGEPLQAPQLLCAGAPDEPAGRFTRMLRSACEEALAAAGVGKAERAGLPLYLGSSSFAIGIAETEYRRAVAEGRPAVALPEAGFGKFLADVRELLGLDGCEYAFNTACTASANALLHAARAIDSGRIEQALVVGVELANYTTMAGFAGMQLLAPEAMRPFDRRRAGLVLGEGCGALLLRRKRRGARTLVLGGGSRCDTFGISASNTDGSAIAQVMADALADAGIAPAAVVAVKGHGTASPRNDDGEAAGLRRIFGSRLPPLFLLKGLTGHTLGACGTVEIALTLAGLESGVRPGSAGYEQPDPALAVEPCPGPGAAVAGDYLFNFFGFGGNNCALVLRQEVAGHA